MSARTPSFTVLLAVVVALLAPACGHEVESPSLGAGAPSAGAGSRGPASPDLVCVEQLTTSVTLVGNGFTPMPSKTLTDREELLLPSVVLLRAADSAGAPVTGDGGVRITDDPANVGASRVHWVDSTKLEFDVTADLALAPGLYDVLVTNPDGTHSARFPGAFAGVPRPTLTSVVADITCDEEGDRTLTLSGTGFLDVGGKLPTAHFGKADLPVAKLDGCTPVPGNHFAGAVRQCTTATVLLPKATLAPGAYDVSLTNPETAACKSTDAVRLTIVPPPTVMAVIPDLLCDAQGDQTVRITGTGFLRLGDALPVVIVGTQTVNASKVDGCTAVDGTFTEGVVESCTSLTFVVKKGLFAPGDFPVVVQNPSPADCKSREAKELVVVPPPAVTAVHEDLLCDAEGAQAMTIDGTGFLQVASTTPTVTVGARSYSTTVDGCAAVVGKVTETPANTCTKLRFTLPMGALPTGDYPVVVVNPSPAACASNDSLAFHVAPPPTLSATATVQVCDAQGAPTVTVMGGDFLKLTSASGTVSLPTVTVSGTPYKATDATGCRTLTLPGGQAYREGTVESCSALSFVLPQASLAPGGYAVNVTNPAPAACTAQSRAPYLTVIPPPAVSDVTPTSVCVGGGTLAIHGTGFIPTPDVAFTDATGVAPAFSSSNTKVDATGTTVTATVAPGVGNVGTTYDVTVTDPGGCHDPSPHQQVKIIQGPVLYFVDPNVVYSGMSTAVTLYLTTIQGGLPATKVVLTPAGGGTPITYLPADPAHPINAVPGHANRVQIALPKGLAAGAYDVSFQDALGCPTVLSAGLTVSNAATLSLRGVVQPFGTPTTQTPITILRDRAAAAPNDTPFRTTPRAFLNPHAAPATALAIPLQSVAFTDSSTLTAIVPTGQALGAYDLIVINPSPGNEVGVLESAFAVVQNPPPTIVSAAPASVVNATGQAVVVTGANFRAGAVVSLPSCADRLGNALSISVPVTSGAPTCTSGSCVQTATIDATSLAGGNSCVLRVTNTDGTYADYSAIGVTGSSLNLAQPRAGTQLLVARRALVAAAANATTAGKYVYALGGDDGATSAAPFSSVESASVDFFGNEGTWFAQTYSLRGPRSFAAGTPIGRYLYICGGTDGSAYLATCERAMVLDPNEAPTTQIADVVLSPTSGLDAGYWYYRVSAVFAASDADNPGGEGLPSGEAIIQVPSLARSKVQVQLSWTAPTDILGTPLANVAGYRIYRSATVNGASGQELLLGTISSATSFVDDGTVTPRGAKALPLGSTGTWAAMPPMSVGRKGLAVTWAQDPTLSSTSYVYAFFGLASTSTANASYELLPITTLANGHQTVGTWKLGTAATTQPRWEIGAFHVDASVFASISSGTHIYVAGGITAAGASAGQVEGGTVQTGGDLGPFASLKSFGAAAA